MNLIASTKQYFIGIWQEAKKVIWPSRKEVINNTIIVIASVAIAAAIFGLADFIFSQGLEYLITFQG